MKLSCAALGALIAGLLVTAAAAQEAPAEDAPRSFGETVDVNVVNVEVYVTDKKGNRITGLKKDDFEILEDRRPVTVTNFYAIEGGRQVGGKAKKVETPALPERRGASQRNLPLLPEDQRLSLIVYVDNFNLRPFNRNRVFRRIREFLHDNVTPHDRVMLVSYDRSINIRHGFTSDGDLIANALYELETLTGHGVHADSERRDILRELDEAEDPSDVSMRLRQYAQSTHHDLLFSLDAIKEFNGWLAGLPGRKAILYVSDGLLMNPGQELFYALQQRFTEYSALSEASEFDASRRFRELAHHANTHRVTFYTIDAAGLRVLESANASNTGTTTPGLSTFIDSQYIQNLQGSLRYLAEETGGLAILNTNDIGKGLSRVAEDFSTFYSLGYSPAHSGDGRYHDIKVRVKRKGLRVRHREGYRDRSLDLRVEDTTLSALRFGVESNPLEIGLEFGESTPRDDGLYEVQVMVLIPLDKIVLLPQDDFHEGRVRVFVAALDEEGGTAPVQQSPVPIRVPSGELETARGETFHYQMSLLMRRGEHHLAVTVRDDLGSSLSSVRRAVFVGS